jgi:hypothetical protein
MDQLYPGFKPDWHCGEVIWTGVVQPHELAQRYLIRVKYRIGEAPVVDVLDPALERRDMSKPVPHLYDDEHLCLYWPTAFEWDASKLIAKTIIPWATLWLHHYEYWRVTGEWLGGGQHPRMSRRQ